MLNSIVRGFGYSITHADKSNNNILSMSNFDTSWDYCYLYNLLDSIHSQHIRRYTCRTIMDIPSLISSSSPHIHGKSGISTTLIFTLDNCSRHSLYAIFFHLHLHLICHIIYIINLIGSLVAICGAIIIFYTTRWV
jgi:hypothetical protein